MCSSVIFLHKSVKTDIRVSHPPSRPGPLHGSCGESIDNGTWGSWFESRSGQEEKGSKERSTQQRDMDCIPRDQGGDGDVMGIGL